MPVYLFRRDWWRDPRLRLLLLWLAFGFVFFSASKNKLPGYLLPLVPAAAALTGIGLDRAAGARAPLALVTALLAIVPVVAVALPKAVDAGLSRAAVDWSVLWWGTPALAAASLAWRLPKPRAFAIAAAVAFLSLAALKMVALPAMERASARPVWAAIAPNRENACVGPVRRSWRYGLNYYSKTPLPDCAQRQGAVRVVSGPGERPVIETVSPAPPAP
jgi:4-amino-4-deoxy-L-arabinose transferase-like glycosyltransferase